MTYLIFKAYLIAAVRGMMAACAVALLLRLATKLPADAAARRDRLDGYTALGMVAGVLVFTWNLFELLP